jgi:hypothetical protein
MSLRRQFFFMLHTCHILQRVLSAAWQHLVLFLVSITSLDGNNANFKSCRMSIIVGGSISTNLNFPLLELRMACSVTVSCMVGSAP